MQDSVFAAYILSHPGITPADVAEDLGVSVRTVRTYVRQTNEAMRGFATIVLDRGNGYHLDVADPDRLNAWSYEMHGITRAEGVPQVPEDRVNYLINDLLMRSDWITLEELAHILFVSRATVSNDLKQVSQALESYGLTIEKRPHYGIRVVGPEMAKRLCLAHHIVDTMGSGGEGDKASGCRSILEAVTARDGPASSKIDSGRGMLQGRDAGDLIETVSSCVERAASANGFKISSFAYQNLLIHVAIALVRVNENCHVSKEGVRLEHIRGTREYTVAQSIADELSQATGVQLPEGEIGYIAIHLAGKQTIDVLPEGDDGSLVISEEVWDVVSQMLECMWNVYRFDFRDDLELRMNLARHIVPLAVRLRYHMQTKNPLLSDIKLRYPLAWVMAGDACSVITQHYDAALSEDEVGYIALSFALALERSKEGASKKTVLIVCSSGTGVVRLLKYRCREEFGDCIDRIVTCDVLDLPSVDFTDIDYVFTTIPLSMKLPVPVREVNHFLDAADAEGLRQELRSGDREHFDMARYFSRDLFFPHLSLATKTEALDFMLDRVCEAREVSPNFRELVWKREASVDTSFGNNVAIPHPLEAQEGETFVAVGLLDEPVTWDGQGHGAQAIFLCSFSDGDAGELQTFFSLLSDMLMSRRAVRALVTDQDWETLCALIATFSTRPGNDEDADEDLLGPLSAGESARPARARRQGGESYAAGGGEQHGRRD